MTDLNKLYAKVERFSKRILARGINGEANHSTFVPSSEQQNSTQRGNSKSKTRQMPHQPVVIDEPYLIHQGFGTGYPQSSYQQPQNSQQRVPPSYGWALNSAAADAAPNTSQTTAFGALSLDVGVGQETAGSGFDHLITHDDEDDHMEPDYLRPDERAMTELRNAQTTGLEKVKAKVMKEVAALNLITTDTSELERWYLQEYPYTLLKDDSITTKELDIKVRMLEERLKRLMKKKSRKPGAPPPRPPPPRSAVQGSTTGTWVCDRCSKENPCNAFRCCSCNLPSRRFDPSEIEVCGCEYCSKGHPTA